MKDFAQTINEILEGSEGDSCFMLFEAQRTKPINDLPDGDFTEEIKKLIARNILGQKPDENTKKYNRETYFLYKFVFSYNPKKSRGLENINIINDFVNRFNTFLVDKKIDSQQHHIFDFVVDNYYIRLQSTGAVVENDEDGNAKMRNKGLNYETQLKSIFDSFKNKPIDEVNDKVVRAIMSKSGLYMITDVIYEKGKATKRTDLSKFPKIDDSLSKHKIGGIIGDITIKGKGKSEPVYVSIKNGKTIKFLNKGVANGKIGFFKPANFAKDNPLPIEKGSKADKLLNVLGMQEGSEEREMFINIFRNYKAGGHSSSSIRVLTNKINEKVLGKIVRCGIGYDYILLHKLNKNMYSIRNITTDYLNKKYSRISQAIGNFGHSGKQEFSMTLTFTSGDQCKITLRDTHSKPYPTTFLLEWMPSPNPDPEDIVMA